MRRASWVALGMAIGAGGTLWTSRRLAYLADRARQGDITGDVVRLMDRGSRRVGRRVAVSVDAGRLEARRRQEELRRAFGPGASTH